MSEIIEKFNDTCSVSDAYKLAGVSMPQPDKSGKILCPFHNESTPSCHVYSHRLHCFGCKTTAGAYNILKKVGEKKQNEIYDIMRDYLGDTSRETRTQDREPEKKEEYKETDKTEDLKQYVKNLEESTDILEELTTARKMSKELIKPFNIGFKSMSEGYKTYTLPITNLKGTPIEFAKYNLGEAQTRTKYEFPSGFQKSRYLFHASDFLENVKTKSEVILCEGFFDAVRLRGSGHKNAAATMGIPSPSQIFTIAKTLKVSTIILALDNDKAGQGGTVAAIEHYLSCPDLLELFDLMTLEYRGKDPDESYREEQTFNPIFGLERMAIEDAKRINYGLSRSMAHVTAERRLKGMKANTMKRELLQIYKETLIANAGDSKIKEKLVADIFGKDQKELKRSRFTIGHKYTDESTVIPPGSMVVIAADSGTGKTSFALWLLMHNAKKKEFKQLFISMEMAKNAIYSKTWGKSAEIFEEGDKYNFIVIEYTTELNEIIELIREGKETDESLEVVYIDYAQCIDLMNNESILIDEITKALRKIAIQLEIVIVVNSQITREASKRHCAPATYDLKGGGQITQDASLIISLHSVSQAILLKLNVSDPEELPRTSSQGGKIWKPKEEYYKNRTIIEAYIKKDRYGAGVGRKFLLKFDKNGILSPYIHSDGEQETEETDTTEEVYEEGGVYQEMAESERQRNRKPEDDEIPF